MSPISILPEQAHARVQFGPPAAWICIRDVDYAYVLPDGVSVSMLLIDYQHYATRHEFYRRVVQRMETIGGVQQAAQWRCEFDPATQQVTIHSLCVQRGAERREHAAPERLRYFQREENLERYTLDGCTTVVLLFEDVRVGDVIDVSYTIHTKARVFPDRFAFLTAIPTDCHARLFHLSVRFPCGHGMRWKTDSQIIQLNERQLEDGETEWSWKVENFAPRAPVPNMPVWHFQGRYIQVTDFVSWQMVATGLAAAWAEAFDHPQLLETAKELSGIPTIEERVESALRLVQDEVRYLSVNTELGGQVPTAPGVVLGRRYGDCKDKAFLLVHLLRRLGVSARPVLVNTGWRHRIAEFLPMPAAFNHVIAEYELAGKRHWVDATIPLQGGGPDRRTLPTFGVGLPIDGTAKDIEPIPRIDDADAAYKVWESFRLESRHAAILLSAMTTATGGYADDLRRQFTFEGAPAIAKARELFYQKLFPGAMRRSELEWRDDRERNELIFADSWELPEDIAARVEPGVRAFQVCAHAIQSAIGFEDSEKRKQPLGVPFPCRVEHEIEFEFATLPATPLLRESAETTMFAFAVEGTRAPGGRTTFQYSFETMGDHVLPKDYGHHRARVLKAWGTMQLPIYYSTGRDFAGKRRAEASLLPPLRARTEEVAVPVAAEVAGLGEIAPCLRSLPVEQQAGSSTASPTPRPRRTARTRAWNVRDDANEAKNARYVIGVVFFFLLIVRIVLSVLMGAR